MTIDIIKNNMVNVTSMIQRAIENNTFITFQELHDHILDKAKSIGRVKRGLYVKKNAMFKEEHTMRYCQRMVRKKQLHYEVIKGLDGFISNPNPNSKRK